jgi:UDP-glucose 4-epimerase
MSLRSTGEIDSMDVTVQTRRNFIDSKNRISIDTLIVSAKTNLWPNENELDLLLHKARESGVNRVILFSSGSVYGESVDASNEDSRLEPVSTYGRYKLLEEVRTVAIFRGVAKILVLRISNVYGVRTFDDITNRCIKSVKEGTPLVVYSGGTLMRDFIYIDDLIKILGQLIQKDLVSELEYLNVSSGKGILISEVIAQISDILSANIKQSDISRPISVAKNSVLDNLKLNELVSISQHSLEEGLKDYIFSQFEELTKPS